MNVVDYGILGIIGLSVLFGFYRGFISSVLNTGGCLASFGLSFLLYPKLAAVIQNNQELVRTLMHWATTALPVIVAVPLLGELLHLPRAQLPVLMASLLLGTPILSLLGAVVAALTVGMRRAGILLALLALPLYVPVLVFGAGAVAQSAQGFDPGGALLFLGAGLVACLVLAPPATAAALRVAHA